MRSKMGFAVAMFVEILLVTGAIVFFLTDAPFAYSNAGTSVFCNSAFPGTCTQGGCDAEPGWYAVNCLIHCSQTLEISCQKP